MRLGRPSKATLILASILGTALLLGISSRDDETDWNPFVRDMEEIEGEWITDSTVLIAKGGRYECRGKNCGDLGSEGTWRREGDFYIEFTLSSQKPQLLRLGLRGRELVAAAGAGPGDPDLWNPIIRFRRARPWNQ